MLLLAHVRLLSVPLPLLPLLRMHYCCHYHSWHHHHYCPQSQ